MTLRNPSARLALGLTGVMFADLATKLAAAAIAAGHTTGPLAPVRNHEFSLGVAGAPLATTVLLAGLAGLALAAAFTLGPARSGELPTWIPASSLVTRPEDVQMSKVVLAAKVERITHADRVGRYPNIVTCDATPQDHN